VLRTLGIGLRFDLRGAWALLLIAAVGVLLALPKAGVWRASRISLVSYAGYLGLAIARWFFAVHHRLWSLTAYLGVSLEPPHRCCTLPVDAQTSAGHCSGKTYR